MDESLRRKVNKFRRKVGKGEIVDPLPLVDDLVECIKELESQPTESVDTVAEEQLLRMRNILESFLRAARSFVAGYDAFIAIVRRDKVMRNENPELPKDYIIQAEKQFREMVESFRKFIQTIDPVDEEPGPAHSEVEAEGLEIQEEDG